MTDKFTLLTTVIRIRSEKQTNNKVRSLEIEVGSFTFAFYLLLFYFKSYFTMESLILAQDER